MAKRQIPSRLSLILAAAGKNNILTIVLAYTDQPHHIRTLRVAPYEEYATRRTRVEFEW